MDGISGETITDQYDALKRLSSATGSGWSETYTYDGFGNMTGMTPTGGAPSLSTTVNWATNQITPSGVSYDGKGNITGMPPSTTLGYDVANRMVSVGGSKIYAYDESNRRVYSNASGTDTIYLYGTGGEKLAAYTISILYNSLQTTFQSQNVYFGGKLISAEGNSVSMDQLDSVRWSAAGSGTARTYYPYGVEYSSTTNDTEKYATYTRDSNTGLDYANNRYYSSTWGRFTSPDPYSATATSPSEPKIPLSWNRSAYTPNDPINLYDPAGQNFCAPIPNYYWACAFSSDLMSGDGSDGDFGSIDYGLTTVVWFSGDDDGDDDDGGGATGTSGPTSCSISLYDRPAGFKYNAGWHTYIDAIFFCATGSTVSEIIEGGPRDDIYVRGGRFTAVENACHRPPAWPQLPTRGIRRERGDTQLGNRRCVP